MPDGTGFKGSGVNGQARKGDLKAVSVFRSKEIFFLWLQKREQLGKRLPMNGIEIKFNDGSILISDEELGLAEAFADYAAEQKIPEQSEEYFGRADSDSCYCKICTGIRKYFAEAV